MLFLCLLVIGTLFVLPIWLLASAIVHLRNKHGGWVRLSAGIFMCMFTLFVLDSCFGPWHEKILDKGTAPDGREYVLLQTNGGEPFEVRLYVRSEEAGWVFYYVDHEVFPWRAGGHVEFAPDSATARVFQGNKVYKAIDIHPPEQFHSEGLSFSPTNTPEDILRSTSIH
jgi:hypothetical protein